jgi:hypothetical protein
MEPPTPVSRVVVPAPEMLPARVMALPESKTDKVLPTDVDELLMVRARAESMRKTFLVETDEMVEAFVLTKLIRPPTSPAGDEETFNVEAFRLAAPDVLLVSAPLTLMVPPASVTCRVCPLATDEALRPTALAAP